MLAKISDEFASRNGNRRMIGRSRALNEAHEVGRADHVEIDVEHDVTTVIFGQTVDMLTRAHEALLLCSPEGETHATRRTVAPSVRPAMSREWPCSYEIPTTGMAAGCLSVPENASVRRSVPSFMR